VAGPLALAALGTTHPRHLDGGTAGWWFTLHLILLPLFPLLGSNLWWLLAGERGALAWAGRVAAFVYLTFYSGLDLLAGVAAGLVRDKATRGGTGEFANVEPWLFATGNDLGDIGADAFLVGVLITGGLLLARHGRRAAPGAALLLVAALLFTRSHIYFPVGVGGDAAAGGGVRRVAVGAARRGGAGVTATGEPDGAEPTFTGDWPDSISYNSRSCSVNSSYNLLRYCIDMSYRLLLPLWKVERPQPYGGGKSIGY